MESEAENANPRSVILTNAVHISVLCAFAVAQPLFDIFSKHAAFFVARHSSPIDLLLLILVLVFLVPLPLVLVEAVAGWLGERSRKVVHGFLIACLTAMIILPLLNRISRLGGDIPIVAAAVIGATSSIIYFRINFIRQLLSVLALALVVFPLFFLFNSSIYRIVFPKQNRATAAAGQVASEAPVVMIIFDELPLVSLLDESHRIDPVRYPSFAALADDSTWFRNATSVSDDTLQAVPAILTGNYPRPELQATVADHPENLFTLLGGAYRFEVSEIYTDLCPPELCLKEGEEIGEGEEGLARRMRSLLSDSSIVYLHLLLPAKWTSKLPPINLGWKNFARPGKSGTSRPEVFLEFVRTIELDSSRTLLFFHLGMPHAPYHWYPSGKSYSKTGREPAAQGWQRGRWVDDQWAVLQSYQRHLLQVGYVDTLLGKLLVRLKEEELYDPSLIVVTSDHGGSFRTDDFRRKVTPTNFPDLMAVPLLIKAPHQVEKMIDDSNVELIDVLPMVADILNIEIPWPVDGRSVLEAPAPQRKYKICYSGNERMEFPASIIEETYLAVERKLISFGSGKTSDRIFGIGPHGGELVGRRIHDMNVKDGNGAMTRLAHPQLFRNVDLESNYLPGEITGYYHQESDIEAPLQLAVAVNGVIRATTYTYKLDSPKESAAWSALVDESVFRTGQNEVEAFTISETRNGLSLERTGEIFVGSHHLGLNLGVKPVPGVGARGFWPMEQWRDGELVRWTRATAKVVVPLDQQDPPAALKIDLPYTGPNKIMFRVLVNDQEVLQETFPGRKWPTPPWSKTVLLDGVSIKRQAVIELVSKKLDGDGFPGGTTRGVALGGLWLLRSSDLEKRPGVDAAPVAESNSSLRTDKPETGVAEAGEVRIFADDFESGGLEPWSVESTLLWSTGATTTGSEAVGGGA